MLLGKHGVPLLAAGSDIVELPCGAASPDAIYFLGDSITLGWRDEDQGGWPARLLRKLHADGYAVTGYNLGIRGDTSSRIMGRWKDEVQRRRRDGNALLIFAFGVNDATVETDGRRSLPIEQTVRNVREILAQAGGHRMLLIGPAPIEEDLMHQRLNANGSAAMPTPASIVDTAHHMAAEARAVNVPFLDLLSAFDQSQAWRDSLAQTDGLHPSSAGHDLIAAQIQSWGAWQHLFPLRK